MKRSTIKSSIIEQIKKDNYGISLEYIGHFKDYNDVVKNAERHPAGLATVDAPDRCYLFGGKGRWSRFDVVE